MKDSLVSSKIVANSTENTWSQAYSTLNLFIVIEIEDAQSLRDKTETIGSYGKTILEKLQREFFAIDKKHLRDIKKAVEKTVEAINNELNFSIVLANIIEDTLYLVTAGSAVCYIKRSGKLGIVAKGTDKKIISFSGKIINKDIIAIATAGFLKKIPPSQMEQLLAPYTTLEIAENIAPIIHGNPRGTESAIILQYQQDGRANQDLSDEPEDEEIQAPKKHTFRKILNTKLINKISQKVYLAKLKALSFSSGKRLFITIAIFALLIILSAGIIYEKKSAESQKLQKLSSTILSQANSKYDQALSMANLNKNEALSYLNEAKNTLSQNKNQFLPDSVERKKIDRLISAIEDKIKNIEAGEELRDKNIIFDIQSNPDVKEILAITYKNGSLISVSQNGSIIFPDNKNIIKTPIQNPLFITSNAIEVFTLGNGGVFQTTKKDKKTQKIIDLTNVDDYQGIDTYLGNIYLLNKKDKSIEKYTPPNFKKSAYLTDNSVLPENTVSMSIDGSIYVIDSKGQIKKYTRGKQDLFEIKNLISPLGNNSMIYTEADFNNLYILDRQNNKIITINKKGEFQKQYNIKSIGQANSFAVNEKDGKIFVSKTIGIYSFSL